MSELKRYSVLAAFEEDVYLKDSISGEHICLGSGEGHFLVKALEAEAALKEKDAEIAALKKRVEKMKCCGNCKHIESGSPACYVCDDTVAENWEARG